VRGSDLVEGKYSCARLSLRKMQRARSTNRIRQIEYRRGVEGRTIVLGDDGEIGEACEISRSPAGHGRQQ
jgi:hypothetical protein